MNPSRIQRALISVSDKVGLVPFARGLHRLGAEIISTGGTAKLLKGQGIPVKEISAFTGFPEILDGRVKTLHPKVHGGILARRQDAKHRAQARKLGLKMIDLVVVNLYPFEQVARGRNAALAELIEQIDIGGVALIRSAAKNFESVGIVSRPGQYVAVLEELAKNRGALSEETRRRLAVEAFAETAYYDSVIHQALTHRIGTKSAWPQKMVLGASVRQVLRYGENPHQAGAWYGWSAAVCGAAGLGQATQLHGKELSFNNLLDLDAALQLVSAFRKPCAAVIKHMNPCGVACASSLKQAFLNAFASDPLSAFGGIVGFNRVVDPAAAKAVVASGFLECLIAPGYEAGALKLLKAKKNLRIIQVPASGFRPAQRSLQIKQIGGGLLVQQPDEAVAPPARWRLATTARPSWVCTVMICMPAVWPPTLWTLMPGTISLSPSTKTTRPS